MNDKLADEIERLLDRRVAPSNFYAEDLWGDEAYRLLRKCQRAALRRSQPEGMVMVPREPSEQMISDGEMRYLEIWYPNESNFVSNPKWRRVVREMFKAMLSAAEASKDKPTVDAHEKM